MISLPAENLEFKFPPEPEIEVKERKEKVFRSGEYTPGQIKVLEKINLKGLEWFNSNAHGDKGVKLQDLQNYAKEFEINPQLGKQKLRELIREKYNEYRRKQK